MSDIKLFRTKDGVISELPASSLGLEKPLQTLIEDNLDVALGVRFLRSEYPTGKTHGGRIDTLGLDENNCPVIIEYKRSINQNVINQGLYYLDWLLDHQAEFTLLCMQALRPEIESKIDWNAPRLICIAGDFTKYDSHAVAQINRNIELVKYKRYGDDFMIFELVNSTTSSGDDQGYAASTPASPKHFPEKTVTQYLEQAPPELRDLYQAVEDFAFH